MPTETNSAELVKSVTKALSILDCFTPTHPYISLTQIASKLNLPKSTVLNLVRTLENAGFLIKSQDSQLYSLGYKILEHSYSLRASMSPVQAALPLLEDLEHRTGLTVYLTTHYNGRVLYLEAVYPTRRFGAYSASGRTHPMHCTSCGKVMLSCLSDDMVDQVINRWGMERRTVNTITDIDILKKELAEIRIRGYAIDNEEETSGMRCIAAAVKNHKGFPTAAVSITGSVLEFTQSKTQEFAVPLLQTSAILNDMATQFPGNTDFFLE